MEYLALYRKYRPKELEEVVGQDEIKKILASSCKNGTISHAYLFSGPRGTGKTTMAKILAKMVNCLDPVDGNACNKCNSCLNILSSNDVIEIDAASNNGVDEIRDLREKANLVPSSAKYKVYIIDEVHMLTTQAFNALLKTLEEPPKHVIFILATTEYYKIPLTITSRCQKFQFHKISIQEIVDRLRKIANIENILIDDDALFEIAKISDGGMRDSINFLDQLRSFNDKQITINDVYEICGDVSSDEIVNLLVNIHDNNYEKITDFFEKFDISGKNYSKFFLDFIGFLSDVILYNKNVNHAYIKNDISLVKKINSLFDIDDILKIVDSLNNLIDKLKNVSRQSLVVVTNFLLIMDKISHDTDSSSLTNIYSKNDVKLDTDIASNQYNVAFNFTPNEHENDVNFTDNSKTNTDILVNDNVLKDNSDKIINKEIIINNTFAVADKTVKSDLQKKFERVDEYLTDKKFKIVAGMLMDIKIEVAGEGYLIFSANNESTVDRTYNNFKLCSELVDLVLEGKYNFVILNYDEWCKYRDEYVENFRKGKKYILQDLDVDEISIVDNKESSIVDKLFDLVGEDVIEFK